MVLYLPISIVWLYDDLRISGTQGKATESCVARTVKVLLFSTTQHLLCCEPMRDAEPATVDLVASGVGAVVALTAHAACSRRSGYYSRHFFDALNV